MGARRDGQRGGTCLPLENVQGKIRFIYNILFRTKSTKIVSTAQNIPAIAGWDLSRTQLGDRAYIALTDPLAVLSVLKASASQQRKGKVDKTGGKGRGEEEQNGETEKKGWRGKGKIARIPVGAHAYSDRLVVK